MLSWDWDSGGGGNGGAGYEGHELVAHHDAPPRRRRCLCPSSFMGSGDVCVYYPPYAYRVSRGHGTVTHNSQPQFFPVPPPYGRFAMSAF